MRNRPTERYNLDMPPLLALLFSHLLLTLGVGMLGYAITTSASKKITGDALSHADTALGSLSGAGILGLAVVCLQYRFYHNRNETMTGGLVPAPNHALFAATYILSNIMITAATSATISKLKWAGDENVNAWPALYLSVGIAVVIATLTAGSYALKINPNPAISSGRKMFEPNAAPGVDIRTQAIQPQATR